MLKSFSLDQKKVWSQQVLWANVNWNFLLGGIALVSSNHYVHYFSIDRSCSAELQLPVATVVYRISESSSCAVRISSKQTNCFDATRRVRFRQGEISLDSTENGVLIATMNLGKNIQSCIILNLNIVIITSTLMVKIKSDLQTGWLEKRYA